MARKHGVEEWTLPALLDLCERPEPLSLEEARLMDFEDVVLVGSVRQAVRSSTLTADGTGIGNLVRGWKSGMPCSSVPDPPNKPVQTHLPQSSPFSSLAMIPTGQSIFNTGSVSTQPTPTSNDSEWAANSGGKKKKGKKR